MARLVLLTFALLALAVPSARANDPEHDPQVRAWLVAAAAYWGAQPGCQGGVGVVRAEWRDNHGSWAWAHPRGCWIALDPDFYPRPAAIDAGTWAMAMCAVVTHEWGHLLGRRHTADPRSIMAPVVPLGVVPGCSASASPPPGAAPHHAEPRVSGSSRQRGHKRGKARRPGSRGARRGARAAG